MERQKFTWSSRSAVIGLLMRNDHVCDLRLNIEYSQWLFLNIYIKILGFV